MPAQIPKGPHASALQCTTSGFQNKDNHVKRDLQINHIFAIAKAPLLIISRLSIYSKTWSVSRNTWNLDILT